MKNKNNIKRLISSLVLLSFLWILFFISDFVYEKQKSNNLNYIPSNSTLAVRIDVKELIKSSIFSILFESKDEKTIQKIKEYIQSRKEKDNKFDQNNLNLFSDVVIFSSPYKDGNVIGISLNLLNSIEFENNMNQLREKNQMIKTIDNVGFILTFLNDSDNQITKSEWTSFFNNTIKNNKRNTFIANERSIFQLQTNGNILGKSTYFSTSNIQLNLIKSGIELDGLFSIEVNKINKFESTNLLLNSSKDEFHFSSSIIPKTLQDSLTTILHKVSCTLPDLKSVSFNYRGVKIVKDNSGMHPLPQMDLLVEFKKSFSIDDFLINSPVTDKIEAVYLNNKLTIAGATYYVRQINASTISIGTTKNLSLIKNKSNELFSVKGNLSSVLKIEGGGMIVSFLEVVPLFHSSFELFNTIDKFDISICKTNVNKAKLKGNLQFKDGHSPINETAKFLFGIRAIQ